MNEEERLVDEVRDIEVQMTSIMVRMRQCDRDMKQLLEAAERAIAKLSSGKLRRHFSQMPENHFQVFQFIAAEGWPTSEVLAERLGRSRKSVRLSVEWLKSGGFIAAHGRKVVLAPSIEAFFSVTNLGPF